MAGGLLVWGVPGFLPRAAPLLHLGREIDNIQGMTLHERAGGWKGTALDLAWLIVRDPTALFIVAANLGAAVYVFFHPPFTHSLFFIYWCDCVLIGLFGILKLLFIPIALEPEAGGHSFFDFGVSMAARTILAAIFAFAYGFVLLCVTAILGGLAGEELRIRKWTGFDERAFLMGLWVPVALLAGGHLVSFVCNYLRKKEYLRRTAQEQLARPFKRVLFIFLALIPAAILVSAFRLPVLLIVVFLPLKIAADLLGHSLDHR